MYKIDKLNLDEKEIREYIGLFSEVYPKLNHLTQEFVEWEYIKNPIGSAVGFNAYHEDQLSAHYATIPMLAKMEGVEIKGLLSLNTSTHPKHQGQGLFTRLANETYLYAKELGYKFIIGVANSNSTPGFLRKLGFDLIQPLDVRAGFSCYRFKKKVSDYRYQSSWGTESLQWRLSNPRHKYNSIAKDGKTYILSTGGKPFLKVLIADFQSQELNGVHLKQESFIKRTYPKLWLGIDSNIDWENTPTIRLPDKMKPSPLNLIFKDLTDGNITISPDSLKFNSLDFDAF